MDHKSWLWRKNKSTEKTIVATEKPNLASNGNEVEIQAASSDKDGMEKDLKILNGKLSQAHSDCSAKDDLVKKHVKMAQEAVAGWEKAKAEAFSLKQELDEALQQLIVHEERVAHLDGALKECMQQLRFVREEQEQRIHDAVMTASKEFEKSREALEEQLSDTSKRLAKAGAENAHLSKTIIAKENMIEALKKQLTQVEADNNALLTRLESTEKYNASLNYEVRVLEKELEIRSEEREFNRRTNDASHKQHLENVKKIAKLESECQSLRVLVRKRLPGPAALAKMRNEVEMLGKDSVEIRRKKFNSTGLVVDSPVGSPESPSKLISVLNEQVQSLEDENKTLKESLNRKTNELQFSRTMFTRTASRLSQMESQLEESSKSLAAIDQPRSSLTLHEFSVASISDIGSDDKASCAESRASALISELEHFKGGKQKGSLSCKSIGASDMNLMDDFIEMEKLAIVTAEEASGNSLSSKGADHAMTSSSKTESNGFISDAVGSEIIPVSGSMLETHASNQGTCSDDSLNGKVPGWLHDVLKMISDQIRLNQSSPDDILEDIKVGLAYINHPNQDKVVNIRNSSNHTDLSDAPEFGSFNTWKPSSNSSEADLSRGVTDADISTVRKSKQQSQSDLSKSISKLIELIEGINFSSLDNDNQPNRTYMVRVFQWKISVLSEVLQQFLLVCYDLLNGKADYEKFARELAATLEWILNNCFSLQDVSSMKDAIKKQFDWDESRSESETEIGILNQFTGADNLHPPKDQMQLPCLVPLNALETSDIQIEEPDNEKLEIRKVKDELLNVESEKKILEGMLQSSASKIESLMYKLQESEKYIAALQSQLKCSSKSARSSGDQNQNNGFVKEDLDAQFRVARVELDEAQKKFSTLEAELKNKNDHCEELEAGCSELQLQLESMTKESSNHGTDHKEKQDLEITAASEKLAECQETILNLGKQLKALATSKDVSLSNKVVDAPSKMVTSNTIASTMTEPSKTAAKDMTTKHRSSLLDQMLAEDVAKARGLKTPEASDQNSGSSFVPGIIEPLEKILVLNGSKDRDESGVINPLAMVPSKKHGGGSLWRKLLWKKKKSNCKKTPSLVSR